MQPHGHRATVAAHEGTKPAVGDYLALPVPGTADGLACYRVTWVDLCMNVDPANMWIARTEFVHATDASRLFPAIPAGG